MTIQQLTISEIYDYDFMLRFFRRLDANNFSAQVWAQVLASDPNGEEAYYNVHIDVEDLLAYCVFKDICTDYYPTRENVVVTIEEEGLPVWTSKQDVKDHMISKYRLSISEFFDTVDPVQVLIDYFEDAETDCFVKEVEKEYK